MRNYLLGLCALLLSISSLTAQCPAPTGLLTSNTNANSTVAFWQGAGQSYEVNIRETGTVDWTSITSSSFAFFIDGLFACTDYDLRVRANCNGGVQSDWSTTISFMTTCPTGCEPPAGQLATNIAATTATFNWLPSGDAGYLVRYHKVGDPDWTIQASVTPTINITGLEQCVSYEWHVAAICGTDTSNYSNPTIFATYCGQCDPPAGGSTAGVTQTDAIVLWQVSQGALSYDYQWRKLGSPWNSIVNITTNTFNLANLEPCADYVVRVRSICDNNDVSDWAPNITFSTDCSPTPCPAPANVVVNGTTYNSVTLAWDAATGADSYVVQQRAIGGDWEITTGISGAGTVISDLNPCTTYDFRVQSGCGMGLSQFSNMVTDSTECIDCDLVTNTEVSNITEVSATFTWDPTPFSDQYSLQYREQGGQWFTETLTTNSYDVSGLEACKTYQFRVRNFCANLVSGWTSVVTFETTCCNAIPTNVDASGISFDAATITWDAASGVDEYLVKVETSGTELIYDVNTNSFDISGLETCEDVTVSVASLCGTNSSAYSTPTTFGTRCCPTPDIIVGTIGTDNVEVSFTGTNANSAAVDVRITSASGTTTTSFAMFTNVLITGLDTCVDYTVDARSDCATFNSAYSQKASFKTSCTSGVLDVLNASLSVYPNPVADFLMIEGEDLPETIQVFDQWGRLVQEHTNIVQDKVLLNVSKLNSGMHMLRLVTKEGSVSRNFTVIR